MLKGKKGFTNYLGKFFPDITHIKYEDINNTEYGGASHFNSNDPLQDDSFRRDTGVTISVSKDDPNIAYRIFDNFADAWYYKNSDDYLIQKLQEIQPYIKLTEFPYGVITKDNFPFQVSGEKADYVIGQVIPYYKGYKDISLCFLNNELKKTPIYYYLQIIEILLEQEKYEIFYQDIHGANFIVDPNTDIVKNIDFAPGRIYFGASEYNYKVVLDGVKNLIARLNRISKFEMDDLYLNMETLEELYEFIKEYYLKVKNDDKVKRLLLK